MSDILRELSTSAARVHLSIGDYEPKRTKYRNAVYAAVNDFLFTEEGARITRFRNAFKTAVVDAFVPAFEQGIEDGGGEPPAQGDDLEWINAQVQSEFGYIDAVFQDLKALKKQSIEDGIEILNGVADARANGYARGLDAIYNQGRVRGAKNRMLTFGGDDGLESCPDCQRMKGQRHRASWWVRHGLVPARGNQNYACGTWPPYCQHFLYDDAGDLFTL
jgi:hypothetical protein